MIDTPGRKGTYDESLQGVPVRDSCLSRMKRACSNISGITPWHVHWPLFILDTTKNRVAVAY